MYRQREHNMDTNMFSILIFTCLLQYGVTDFGCGENEWTNGCGSPCQATCDTPHINCIEVCSGPPCRCIEGYVRNAEGKCIKLEDCPKKECPQNEVWDFCGEYCARTCEGQDPFCPLICTTPGCYCREGFVRNSTGTCVRPEECPKTTNI